MIKAEKQTVVKTSFHAEEYIPLKVVLNDSIDEIKYLQYRKDAFNLLEITVDKTTNEFYRLQLVICNHFSIKDKEIPLIQDCEEGIPIFMVEDKVETKRFEFAVYNDGAIITFENDDVTHWIKTGNIFFGLNKGSNLSSIVITNITPAEKEHIVFELNQG